jgi:hypothetical protein
MNEKQALDTCQGLDVSAARDLLRQQGFDMAERFEHVHATRDHQEWHVCLVAELASMGPAQFLVCLEEALTFRLDELVPLSKARTR